ncbi:MAG: threonine/serine exporter family protein [Clostridia bacterium]|nr:threonine/serine exporter family protein [Clostridia bacterium]
MDNRIDLEELLDVAITLGYRLLMCGAEISRVEEAIQRLLRAYGTTGDVFAIPNCLIVTLCPDGTAPITRMRRIGPHGTDIDGVERFYSLARRLCAEKPKPEEAHAMLRETKRTSATYSFPMQIAAYFIAASAFAFFFGANLSGGVLAGIAGVLTGLWLRALDRLQVNPFFQTITASFFIGIYSQALTHFGLILYADATAIGALMLLVPGMKITDSMRDVIYGDTLSGVNKLMQVFLTTAALLLGTGTALLLSRALWHTASVGISLDVPYPWWIQVTAAAFSCLGFCLLYNIRTFGMFICMAGGALGWGVYLAAGRFGAKGLLCNFLAAAAISLYAEIMARIRKFPSFSYLVIALLPLVPGAGVYYTVEYLLQEDASMSLRQGTETAAIAGLLAVGIMMVSSVFRMIGVAKQQMREKHANRRRT